jgi:hypothetical protein
MNSQSDDLMVIDQVANPNWSLGRISKKLPKILIKTQQKHPKYWKITWFQNLFGNFFLGRGLATPVTGITFSQNLFAYRKNSETIPNDFLENSWRNVTRVVQTKKFYMKGAPKTPWKNCFTINTFPLNPNFHQVKRNTKKPIIANR